MNLVLSLTMVSSSYQAQHFNSPIQLTTFSLDSFRNNELNKKRQNSHMLQFVLQDVMKNVKVDE
jgi:hypothetical protein